MREGGWRKSAFATMRSDFRCDLSRHFVYHPKANRRKKLALCLMLEGIWAMAVYRFGRYLKDRGGSVRYVLWPLFRVWELVVRLLTGISLDIGADIGAGFYVGHHGAIYVGPGCRIGANCNIGQMCYVGSAMGVASAAPQVGSGVYFGPGCKVVGAIIVGDGVAIATGAVVLDDVPAGTTVVGNPARVVSKTGADELIYLGAGKPPLTGVDAVDCSGPSK